MAHRAQYSDEVKEIVKRKYHLCRTPEDRDALAQELGIGSRQKLYNLASRLLATRPHANSHTEWAVDEEEGYDATQDEKRLYIRDNPQELEWTEDNDRYLREHFGKDFIEEIAFYLNRSETSVAYRARHLGLRNIPKYYDVQKVHAWLGLSLKDLFLLPKRGLQVFPCTDRRGQVRITLVSTTSLARVLIKGRLWKLLLDKYDADEHFIRDVIESVAALQQGEADWEPNPWVSHGHTCLNPFSENCFHWFYNGDDEKMSGEDLDPRDLAPSARVVSDNWRRGTYSRPDFEAEIREIAPDLDRHRRELEEELEEAT